MTPWTRFSAPPSRHLAGFVLRARSTGRVLVLQRPEGTWEGPGGHAEGGEAPRDTALRELCEETGYAGPVEAPTLLQRRRTPHGAHYYSFEGWVPEEFRARTPEHVAHQWAAPRRLPSGVHPAFRAVVVSGA